MKEGMLWTAWVECRCCKARGPQVFAIGQEAAVSVACGRWSELVYWMRASILAYPQRN